MVVADQNKSRLVLVSGPSRGGKSRWAEHLLSEDLDVTYVATAPDRPDDQDWQTRLALHADDVRVTGTSGDRRGADNRPAHHSSALVRADRCTWRVCGLSSG